MKRILCIDGGGAKGIIPITVLAEIEKTLEKRICDTFDLIVGSSIGSIIGGILSVDAMSASALQKKMKEELPQIFEKKFRIPVFQPKYSRKLLTELFQKYVGLSTPMSLCETMFMCTSVNIVDGKTHFFKSWEEKDGQIPLADAMTRSYAAPLFFGQIVDKKNKSVWLDGGTGMASCPLDKTYVEIQRQKWQNNRVHVLSLGCGEKNFGVPFNKAKHYRNIRQVLFYNNPVEGGLAREQITQEQVTSFYCYSEENPDLSFQRLDIANMPKKEDGMDKIQYIPQYEQYGLSLSKKVDYENLH